MALNQLYRVFGASRSSHRRNLGVPANSEAGIILYAHLDGHNHAHMLSTLTAGGVMQSQPLPKKPTNLSLDQALLQEARELGVNLSQAAEHGLRQAIASAKAAAWKRENQAALESSNAWVEKRGLPLDRYRRF